ncbi:3-deoxy-D-manno-octulosonic acid transferase, partial [Aquicoccus sp. SCR17]|nr:3-deoxy-D-manno-octulosonic acid transferase [Carideicomes alvinocaridis]
LRGPAVRRPTLWLHGASNGELASARPVIEALRAARPGLRILVTCNTVTGREMVRGWGLEARLAPLDLRWIARRLIRRQDIRALVTLEAELWPNRHAALAEAGRPVILLGARLSPGTAAGWGRFPALASQLMEAVTFASPQDTGSARRLAELGLPEERIGPVVAMKSLYRPADLPAEPALEQGFDRGATWLAASTHPGEEEIALAAHAEARATRPGLRLILAPRHPRRGDEIARLVAQAGLTCDRRSAGEQTGAAVLLADTMGEMDRWYALAGTVFVGGSLAEHGGHTPFEPMAHGCALLHGPDVANFTAAYAALDEAGGAREVTDAASLCAAILALADPAARAAMTDAARAALAPEAGLDALVADLLAALDDQT